MMSGIQCKPMITVMMMKKPQRHATLTRHKMGHLPQQQQELHNLHP